MDEEYLPGVRGEVAVCYVLKATGRQVMLRTADEAEARTQFDQVKSLDDVKAVALKSGLRAGERSPVVWIARCEGGTEWVEIVETDGSKQHFDELA